MTTDELMTRLTQRCGVMPGDHVLAAVSGGADSVALLALLRDASVSLGLSVSCAHVEHGIRGAASKEDMAFVRALCKKWEIPFYSCCVDAPSYAKTHGCGMEDAARHLRYDFLESTAREIGAKHIALAHHLGDQAETVLLHAGRGCALRGIGAMRMRRGMLIRPLLDVPPKELRSYLEAIGQSWREDETNQSEAYARNRIRRRVMPELEAACPGAERALSRLALCAQRDEDFIESRLEELGLCREIMPLADGAAISAAALSGLHEALKSRMLVRLFEAAGAKEISLTSVERVMQMLGCDDAAAALCGGMLARLGGGFLAITREEEAILDTPLCSFGETQTPFGVFFVREARPQETGDGMTCQVVPAEMLEGATVGERRTGETMIPFGRKTPVKIKKLMIDAGVPRALRRSVPVIRNGETVLWVVGLRPAEACRAQEGEKRRMIVFGGR